MKFARVNLQIVGQVVLLQRVGLKAMRHFVKVFTSNSTYKTLCLEKKGRNVWGNVYISDKQEKQAVLLKIKKEKKRKGFRK